MCRHLLAEIFATRLDSRSRSFDRYRNSADSKNCIAFILLPNLDVHSCSAAPDFHGLCTSKSVTFHLFYIEKSDRMQLHCTLAHLAGSMELIVSNVITSK
jgi:hypothetical protein